MPFVPFVALAVVFNLSGVHSFSSLKVQGTALRASPSSFEEFVSSSSSRATSIPVGEGNPNPQFPSNKSDEDIKQDDHDDVPRRADVEHELVRSNGLQGMLEQPPTGDFVTEIFHTGVVRIDGGIDSKQAVKLQNYLDEKLQNSLDDIASFRVPRSFRFANVLEKQNRWDLLLPLGLEEEDIEERSDVLLEALHQLLVFGPVGRVLEESLGPNAVLYELACLISDPGSQAQEIHPDIAMTGENVKESNTRKDEIPLIACFVSLQDIDETMGPTLYLPGTVSKECHSKLQSVDESVADEFLKSSTSKLNTLQAGDCSLYDPRVLHAGSANRSDRNLRRRLFYVTFLNGRSEDPSYDLNPGSIRPELKSREWTLSQLKTALVEWKRKNSSFFSRFMQW